MTQEPGWWVQHPPMSPPPPRPPERFPWVVVTVVGAVLASGVGLVTLLGLMMWPYLTHDRIDFIEDETVLRAVERPCAELDAEAAGLLALSEDPDVQAREVRAVAALAGDVPAAVLALDDDVLDGDLPARSWARDWERVVATLEAYALDLETTGAGELRWPRTGDGWSILERMADAEGGCAVPDVVAALDPTPSGPTVDARFAEPQVDP